MKKGKKQKKESTYTNQPSSLMQKSNHPSPPGRPVPPHNLIQNQTNENEISIRFKDFLHFLHTTKSNIFLSLYWLSQVGFFFFSQQKNQMKERTTNSTRNDYSPFVPNNRIQNQKIGRQFSFSYLQCITKQQFFVERIKQKNGTQIPYSFTFFSLFTSQTTKKPDSIQKGLGDCQQRWVFFCWNSKVMEWDS